MVGGWAWKIRPDHERTAVELFSTCPLLQSLSSVGLAPVVKARQGGQQVLELVEGKHVGAVAQRLGGIGMRFDEHPVQLPRPLRGPLWQSTRADRL